MGNFQFFTHDYLSYWVYFCAEVVPSRGAIKVQKQQDGQINALYSR